MKITVLIDQAGGILATQCTSVLPSWSSDADRTTTEFAVPTGHAVCEVEIPSELHAHLDQDTLAEAVDKFRIERGASGPKLVLANNFVPDQ